MKLICNINYCQLIDKFQNFVRHFLNDLFANINSQKHKIIQLAQLDGFLGYTIEALLVYH